MSQAGLLDVENSYPQIPTLFVTDSGSAIAILNEIDIIGGEGIDTFGSGKTITVVGETATAGATALLANLGVASFNSADFDVVNGFVSISSTFGGIQEILTDSGLPAVIPDGTGLVEIIGGIGTTTSGLSPSNKVTINTNITSLDSTITVVNAIGNIDLTAGDSLATQYITDSGIAIPILHTLNVIGGNSIVTSGALNNITIKNMADNTKWVVDPRAGETNFTTIQSAIDAAYADYLVSGLPQTVFIRNGTYTENLTHYVNVNLVSDNALQTIIIGQNAISITGNICFSNITFQNNADNLFLGSGNLINATFNNCIFDTNFSIFRIGTLSGDITLNNCFNNKVNNAFVYNPQGTTNFNIFNSRFVGGTIYTSVVGDATHIGGDYLFVNSEFDHRVEFTNGGTVEIYNSIIKDELYGLVGSSGGYNFYVENSYLFANRTGDFGSCITGYGAVITIINSTIDVTGTTVNNYAISGSGTLTLDSVTFVRATAINPALTISTPSLFETGSLKLSSTTTGALSAASGVVSAGTLTVANGGTGAATLLDHGVLVGSGTAAITALTVGNTGELLVGATGADPVFGTSADGNFTFTTATAGTDRTLSVTNTENTNAASHAHTQITTGGASGGDPYTNYLVSGAGTYSIGIDNSDSDYLKITTGATPSAGSTLMRLTNSGNIYVELGDFYVQRSTAGGIVELLSSNTDNTNAASSAGLFAMVGGTSAGDPYTNYLVSGAGTYSVGIDNSDSDKFKITSGSTPSSGTDLFTMTSAGVITLANDLDVSEGGTGVSTLTSHGILMGNGAGDINATAEPTNGQLLIGKTGDFPQLATLTAGSNVTITNAAGSITIAASGGGAGSIVNYESATQASVITCTSGWYIADSIPTKTQGAEIVTCSITPTSASNLLVIKFHCWGTKNTNTKNTGIALFQDSTTNSLRSELVGDVDVQVSNGTLFHTMTAGTTSETTFKIRGGINGSIAAECWYINGDVNGNRRYGGTSAAQLEIWEIQQ